MIHHLDNDLKERLEIPSRSPFFTILLHSSPSIHLNIFIRHPTLDSGIRFVTFCNNTRQRLSLYRLLSIDITSAGAMDETQQLNFEEMAANAAAIAENADVEALSDASAAPDDLEIRQPSPLKQTHLTSLRNNGPPPSQHRVIQFNDQHVPATVLRGPKMHKRLKTPARPLATRFPSQHRYLCPHDDCTSASNNLSSSNRHASTIHNAKTKLSERDVVIKPYGEWLAGGMLWLCDALIS